MIEVSILPASDLMDLAGLGWVNFFLDFVWIGVWVDFFGVFGGESGAWTGSLFVGTCNEVRFLAIWLGSFLVFFGPGKDCGFLNFGDFG